MGRIILGSLQEELIRLYLRLVERGRLQVRGRGVLRLLAVQAVEYIGFRDRLWPTWTRKENMRVERESLRRKGGEIRRQMVMA